MNLAFEETRTDEIAIKFKMMGGRALVMALSALTLCSTYMVACEPVPGELVESREQKNEKFRIRTEIYHEGNRAHLFERGCHLKLASAPVASNDWRQFANAYYSRCDQVPQSSARFVNDQTAYVFMQWWYSVTIDGGTTWSTCDVPKNLPAKAYYNSNLIQGVSLQSDGTGTMTLNPEGVRSGESLTLYTRDFGINWTEQ